MKQPPTKPEIEALENQLKEKTIQIETAIQDGRIFEEVKEIFLEKKRILETIGCFEQLQNIASNHYIR